MQGRLNAVSTRYEKFLKDTNRTPIESLTQVGGYHRIKAAEASGGAQGSQSGAVSGALSDLNDPGESKRGKDSKKFYEFIRNSNKGNNIRKIAEHSGFTREDVETILNHVFFEKHDLTKGYDYFDESFQMVQSFRRLLSGVDVKEHDVTMLHHELMESKLMRQGMDFDSAHEMAQTKYNYAQTANALDAGEISLNDTLPFSKK